APRDEFGIVGTVLGDRYLVREVVAEGGFAIVYRAEHVVWQRPVAIKAYKKGRGSMEAFIREGAILAELSEASVAACQARDASSFTTPEGDVVPYLVLE